MKQHFLLAILESDPTENKGAHDEQEPLTQTGGELESQEAPIYREHPYFPWALTLYIDFEYYLNKKLNY